MRQMRISQLGRLYLMYLYTSDLYIHLLIAIQPLFHIIGRKVDGVESDLGAVAQFELFEDGAHVVLDGGVGQFELARDLFIGAPLREQRDHLAFAQGERLRAPGGGVG